MTEQEQLIELIYKLIKTHHESNCTCNSDQDSWSCIGGRANFKAEAQKILESFYNG